MTRNPRPAAYHKLSLQDKQAESMARVREPSVMCPTCDTHVMPDDMPAHLRDRCAGPRAPGPGAKWIRWQEAKAMVPEATLVRWIQRGDVRFVGDVQNRRYLMRDLAWKISLRNGFRRR